MKARQPYGFGVKASFSVTAQEGSIVAAPACPGNPCAGDTLAEQVEQTVMVTGTPVKRLRKLAWAAPECVNLLPTVSHRIANQCSGF